jgi:hypothetical protein
MATPASKAMMRITTISSISEKPGRSGFILYLSFWVSIFLILLYIVKKEIEL